MNPVPRPKFFQNNLFEVLIRWAHLFLLCICFFVSVGKVSAVEASVIVASVEGDVSSISIKENFKVTLDASSIGKKIESNSVVLTGKSASASLLFSNGVLITIKPGSRFYLKKYTQKNFKSTSETKPAELEEEPSNSELLAHLDFGDLIVKAPKLNKGSSMLVTSPLGTAGIRGTMFQLVAVRNPLNGDITGGVNLISGDISFTDVGGEQVSLVSGQSLQLANGRLGESRATVPGGLINLSAIYNESLTAGAMPPSIDMLFPNINPSVDDEMSLSEEPVDIAIAMDGDWEMVHEIASEIFFTIESAEFSSSSFSFDSLTNAVPVTVPDPEPQIPSVPMSVSGNEAAQLSETFSNLYLDPPSITITSGANAVYENPLVIEYLVKRKFINYPIADYGAFRILASPSSIYPSYSAVTLGNIDITANVKVSNTGAVDYSVLGQETQISLYVDDFAQRKIKFADGTPVSATSRPTVRIIDSLKPIISFSNGNSQANPYLVEGIPNTFFTDPGISVLDNYYSEQEIISHMALADGLASSSFGSVNMNIAGVYEITYQGISDPSGNVADSKTRWVEVYDNIAPSITLYGANPVYIDLNSSNQYKDLGVFATDNLDGTIEWGDSRIEVFVEALVDENSLVYAPVDDTLDNIVATAKTEDSGSSTYRLKYIVTDLAGNKSEVFRQVALLNSKFKAPTILLNGVDPLYHEVNDFSNQDVNGKFFFPDPGVTAYKVLGNGLGLQNLNDRVTVISYLGSTIQNIDVTTVNYNYSTGKYVNQSGQEDSSKKITLRYQVTDEFGNQATLDREVRIRDTTAPIITPNSAGGVDLSNYQAGLPFTDFGAVATDNYDKTPAPNVSSVIQKEVSTDNWIDLIDPSSGNIVDTISNIGFWEPGKYRVLYTATDSNGNTGTNSREITVVDTILPYIGLIPHSFLSSPSTNSLTASVPTTDSIVNSVDTLPASIVNALTSLDGMSAYDLASKTFDQSDPTDSPYINTFTSDEDFYFKDDPLAPSDIVVNDATSGGSSQVSYQDDWGRSFIWYSAFKINFTDPNTGATFILRDPGIYVRNDSNLAITVSSTIDSSDPKILKVTYYADQGSGGSSQIVDGRSIHLLDNVAPTITLSPTENYTDGTVNFILIEGGTEYGDISTSVDLWQSGTKVTAPSPGPGTLSVMVNDADDGDRTNFVVRTIYAGTVNALNLAGSTPLVTISKTDPSGNVLSDSSISNTVKTYITSLSRNDLDKIFTIKYDAVDSLGNAATSAYRYLTVKDTLPPVINNPTSISDLIVNYGSLTPNVSIEQDMKNYLVSDLNVTDQYWSASEQPSFTWNVTILKPDGSSYDTANPFPSVSTDSGYIVSIKVADPLANETASAVTRGLKIGDTVAPTITMLGKTEIHDFLRFARNPNTPPSPAIHSEEITGQDYNATGLTGGEHRLLYSDYNFVDPGVYAEDDNSYWNISTHPDLDGDGVGEGYAFKDVSSYADVIACASGPGIIHVFNKFTTIPLTQLQQNLEGGGFGSLAPNARVPDPSQDNLTDSNKPAGNAQQLNMITVKISYRVKDGWNNFSADVNRTVYVYESDQYGSYAFYATPLTDDGGGAFEDFHDNNISDPGNPFLTSVRKDTDGDGVSDFWEVALGSDPQNPLNPPDLTKDTTWNVLNSYNLDPSQLTPLLQRLSDSSALQNAPGFSDFNATFGL